MHTLCADSACALRLKEGGGERGSGYCLKIQINQSQWEDAEERKWGEKKETKN